MNLSSPDGCISDYRLPRGGLCTVCGLFCGQRVRITWVSHESPIMGVRLREKRCGKRESPFKLGFHVLKRPFSVRLQQVGYPQMCVEYLCMTCGQTPSREYSAKSFQQLWKTLWITRGDPSGSQGSNRQRLAAFGQSSIIVEQFRTSLAGAPFIHNSLWIAC